LVVALAAAACGGSEDQSSGSQPVGTDGPTPVQTSPPASDGSAVSPDNTAAPTNGDSAQLGILMSLAGFGSLTGALALASLRSRRRGRLLRHQNCRPQWRPRGETIHREGR